MVKKRRVARGFTLVELMLVIVVLAILLAWGIPSFTDYIARKRIDAAATQLVASVQLARSQAITTGKTVSLCGSSNGTACNESDWGAGWLVYIGSNRNIAEPIQHYSSKGASIQGVNGIQINPFGLSAEAASFTITASGTSHSLNITFDALTLKRT